MVKIELTDNEYLDFIEELHKNAFECYNEKNMEETTLGCLLVLNNIILYLRRLTKKVNENE